MTDTYLIFEMSDEWDSLIGVVKLDRSLIERHMKLVSKLKSDGLTDLIRLQFWSNMDVYEPHEGIDKWLEERELYDKFQNDRRVAVDEDPDFGRLTDSTRLDYCILAVGEDSFHWEISPKHWNTLETHGIYNMEEL